jgi:hypothetical protein
MNGAVVGVLFCLALKGRGPKGAVIILAGFVSCFSAFSHPLCKSGFVTWNFGDGIFIADKIR